MADRKIRLVLEAQDRATRTIRSARDAVKETTRAARGATNAFSGLQDSIEKSAGAVPSIGKAVKGQSSAVQALSAQFNSVAKEAVPLVGGAIDQLAGATGQWLTGAKVEWDRFASKLLSDLARMLIQLTLAKALKGVLTGGFGFLFSAGGEVGSPPRRMAAGGMTVPGTGFTDGIPALLSPGEVVLRRDSAVALGELLRFNRSPRTGGEGAGITVNVSGNGDPLSIRAAVRAALREERMRNRELNLA